MRHQKLLGNLKNWRGVNFVTDPTWGDNGKGKVIDLLAQKANLIVRVNGGPNAGHTVVNKFGEFKLHLIPSGIFNSEALCILSDTVVVNPLSLVEEITTIKKTGITINNKKFLISRNAHLIMPWHRKRDNLREAARGSNKIGTTGQGIGPTYSDRTERVGLKVGDLLDPNFEALFKKEIDWQEKLIRTMSGRQFLADIHRDEHLSGMTLKQLKQEAKKQAEEMFYDSQQILESILSAREVLAPLIDSVLPIIWQYHSEGKRILGEAGQGVLLDLDRGSYPDVTSSHPGIAGFNLATGINPREVERVIGVTKVYATRVGSGPLPTELFDDVGETIRQTGHEFGATTGRPRRCGWLDIPAMKYGCRVGGIDSLALTKLDIFDEFSEIKICIGYTAGNKTYTELLDADSQFMKNVTPIYETLSGWGQDTKKIQQYKDLPKRARNFVEGIEKLVDLPVELVSVGPHRESSMYR